MPRTCYIHYGKCLGTAAFLGPISPALLRELSQGNQGATEYPHAGDLLPRKKMEALRGMDTGCASEPT